MWDSGVSRSHTSIVAILGTIAKQERLRISERVRAGLERTRTRGTKSGKPVGRPQVVFRRDKVAEMRLNGLSWRETAHRTGASVRTMRRVLGSEPPLLGVAKTCAENLGLDRVE